MWGEVRAVMGWTEEDGGGEGGDGVDGGGLGDWRQ